MLLKKLSIILLSTLAYTLPTERTDLLCENKDSCAGEISSYTERNCRCDSDCGVYGDCCFDAANQTYKIVNTTFQCITAQTNSRIPDSFYMIADCPSYWNISEISSKCTTRDDKEFPQMVPVTYKKDKTIYRNIFCALCHELVMEYIEPWDLKLECPSSIFNNSNEAKDHLQFNPKVKRWIIKTNDKRTDMCLSTVRPSEKSDITLRSCESNVINKCAKDWKHPQTVKLCKKDTAYRYLSEAHNNITIYKNKYCAKCNNIRFEDLECTRTKYASPVSRDLTSYRGSSLLNFAIIMNSIFLKNTATQCSAGLVYNSATKNCEELHCSQDTVKENGLCVDI